MLLNLKNLSFLIEVYYWKMSQKHWGWFFDWNYWFWIKVPEFDISDQLFEGFSAMGLVNFLVGISSHTTCTMGSKSIWSHLCIFFIPLHNGMKSFMKEHFFFLTSLFYALSLQFSIFLILRVVKKLISQFTINFVPNGQKWQVLAFLAFFLILFKYYLNLEQRIDFFKDKFQRISFRNIALKEVHCANIKF